MKAFLKRAAGLLRSIRSDRRGAAAVEMALAAPILTLAIAAAYDLSQGFAARLDLVQAAQRSAELATSLGQVRADYGFLQTEAVTAATASGAKDPSASIDAWLECDGVRQSQANAICPAGQQFARYVSVEVNDTYFPLFTGAGLLDGGGVPIRGAATVRIQ
jgi:Flp pilus assembly protein TadG